MLQLTGDARYADVMERVLHNAALSAISLSGEKFTYTNPLRFNGKDHFRMTTDRQARWTRHTCYCCPPQISRTIAGLHRWTYSTSDTGLWVHLYGSNRIETEVGETSITLSQQSDYPWSGDIRFEVETAPSGAFTLNLRIPGWCEAATLSVNGEAVDVAGEGARYVPVTRDWAAGDVVELSLDMTPRIVAGHPKVEEIRNQCAVICGPVVYCLEGADLPEGMSLNEVGLSADAVLTKKPGAGLFEGMTVLETNLRRRPKWSDDALYAPLSEINAETVTVSLIPYFAWNNRNDNTMMVWLPLQWS